MSPCRSSGLPLALQVLNQRSFRKLRLVPCPFSRPPQCSDFFDFIPFLLSRGCENSRVIPLVVCVLPFFKRSAVPPFVRSNDLRQSPFFFPLSLLLIGAANSSWFQPQSYPVRPQLGTFPGSLGIDFRRHSFCTLPNKSLRFRRPLVYLGPVSREYFLVQMAPSSFLGDLIRTFTPSFRRVEEANLRKTSPVTPPPCEIVVPPPTES